MADVANATINVANATKFVAYATILLTRPHLIRPHADPKHQPATATPAASGVTLSFDPEIANGQQGLELDPFGGEGLLTTGQTVDDPDHPEHF